MAFKSQSLQRESVLGLLGSLSLVLSKVSNKTWGPLAGGFAIYPPHARAISRVRGVGCSRSQNVLKTNGSQRSVRVFLMNSELPKVLNSGIYPKPQIELYDLRHIPELRSFGSSEKTSF